MNIDIASILQNFIVALVVMYLSDRERKTILDRLDAYEKRYEALNKEYIEALRDWSGIEPKFSTWKDKTIDPRSIAEGDTASRNYMIDDRERQRAIDLMNK